MTEHRRDLARELGARIDAFHAATPGAQGETGDGGVAGQVLCQWVYDNAEAIKVALSPIGHVSCDLCAGACRGHSLGRPEEWEPERGSRAWLLLAARRKDRFKILRAILRWFSGEGQHPYGCDCEDCVKFQAYQP